VDCPFQQAFPPRGGSFINNDNNLHAANRNNNPTNANNNIGFRV